MENNEKDAYLWRVAKKRVQFKRHFVAYLTVNSFLWVLWFISRNEEPESIIPWPIWSTVGWGFGIAWSYASAYVLSSRDPIEKEYEKLKNQGR